MKLVSEGALEKVKHSFRLSQKCVADEPEPVKDKEEAQQRKPKPKTGSSVLRKQVREANGGEGVGRGRRGTREDAGKAGGRDGG